MKLIYSDDALADLDEIWLYLAQDSFAAADLVTDRIVSAGRALEDFPDMGVSRDDLGSGLRALIVENYLIFYRRRGGRLTVERILHGRRDIRPELF